MLTLNLRKLERDGLLVRTVYPTVPPKVEYRLTPSPASSANRSQPSPRGRNGIAAPSPRPAAHSTVGSATLQANCRWTSPAR